MSEQVGGSALGRAEALVAAGEARAGLKALERARRDALTAEDPVVLAQVRAVAQTLEGRVEGRYARRCGEIAYSASQNLRHLTRAGALAEGREWETRSRLRSPREG